MEWERGEKESRKEKGESGEAGREGGLNKRREEGRERKKVLVCLGCYRRVGGL